MKRYSKSIVTAFSLGFLLLSACTRDFEEINENPNFPKAVTPDVLLPNIIRESVNTVMNESWSIGNIVAQHTAKIQFVNEDRYQWGDRSTVWNNLYGVLRDVNNMLVASSQPNTERRNYQGIALVMRAWIISVLTDTYGDVPYTEAIEGKTSNYYPQYDRQEDIYNGILADLERANELLDPTNVAQYGVLEQVSSDDILFGGNILKWKKLANSLRLRYLMRISNKRDVSAQMQAIISNPTENPVFTSNDDNAALRYEPVVPNKFPLYTSRSGSVDEFRLSKTLADRLIALNDPRIQVFARPTVASVEAGNPQYVGVPNGLDDVTALTYNGGAQNISRIGAAYYIDGSGIPTEKDRNIARGIIMTYAELQFILAEAAHKGLIATGTAQDYYEEGIEASFNYFGLEVPNGYLSQPGVAFNAANALQLIGTQKWIALFYSGLEAWFDWRRTGVPNLQPGPANLNNNRIPVRYAYPNDELSLNPDNLQEAVSRQEMNGFNDYNDPVWWDE